jgi:hypothetical protein
VDLESISKIQKSLKSAFQLQKEGLLKDR